MSYDDLYRAAARGVSAKAAVKRHAQAQNSLLRIGGEILTMGEVCAKTGLDSRLVRARYSKGRREWADFGVTV